MGFISADIRSLPDPDALGTSRTRGSNLNVRFLQRRVSTLFGSGEEITSNIGVGVGGDLLKADPDSDPDPDPELGLLSRILR
jgi:hypothetical protein